MPHVLLIGANGFIASHLLSALLASDLNFHITATVRSDSKLEAVLSNDRLPIDRSRVRLLRVPDIAGKGAWDTVFAEARDNDREGFGEIQYVLHPAAPMPDGVYDGAGDFENDFMRAGIDGVLEVMRAAKRHGTSVKHISITGSISNLRAWDYYGSKDKPITANDWNPISIETARASESTYLRHHAAKKFSELAVWDFVEKEKPGFSVSVINPTMIFGPPIQPVTSLDKINMTTDMLYELYSGKASGRPTPKTYLSASMDVRDLAKANVNALTSPSAANKRFVIGTVYYSSDLVVEIIKKRFPEIAGRLPTEKEGDVIRAYVDDGNACEALGFEYRSLDETITDSIEVLKKLEENMKK